MPGLGLAIPGKGGNTEFADMRAAHDALDDETKAICRPLVSFATSALKYLWFRETDHACRRRDVLYRLLDVERRLARETEARGFESLWAPEHSHIPVARGSGFPSGGELPKQYYDAMDPFVSLSTAAAVTTTLKLGTGVCLVVQRDPIQTAKLVASLDQVSNGRFLFGVGGGWNAEEMADHGTAFKTRFKLMRERIEAMQAIWTETTPEYHGEFVDFPPMKTWPKPVQKPHPPVIVGGMFPHGARRALRYGNGWIPHSRRPVYEDVTDYLPQFRQMAAEAGRDLAEVPVTVWGIGEDLDRLNRYRDQGVARIVISLPAAGRDTVMPMLDRWAELIRGLAG